MRLAFHRAKVKMRFLSCILALLVAAAARAGTEPAIQPGESRPADDHFAFGAKEFQNVTGAFFFFDTTKNQRPSIDFALDTMRLGVMLNDPSGLGPVTDNFELLGEISAGPVVRGPGNVLAGGSLGFCYYFIQPDS